MSSSKCERCSDGHLEMSIENISSIDLKDVFLETKLYLWLEDAWRVPDWLVYVRDWHKNNKTSVGPGLHRFWPLVFYCQLPHEQIFQRNLWKQHCAMMMECALTQTVQNNYFPAISPAIFNRHHGHTLFTVWSVASKKAGRHMIQLKRLLSSIHKKCSGDLKPTKGISLWGIFPKTLYDIAQNHFSIGESEVEASLNVHQHWIFFRKYPTHPTNKIGWTNRKETNSTISKMIHIK